MKGSGWLKALDPRVLGKSVLPIVVVAVVVAGIVSGLVVALGKPSDYALPPSLVAEEAKAFSNTNTVSITLRNPSRSAVNVDKASIVTVRRISYVSSIATDNVDVVCNIDAPTTTIETYPWTPFPYTYTVPGEFPGELVSDVQSVLGKCCPDCHGCVLNTVVSKKQVPWSLIYNTINVLGTWAHKHGVEVHDLVADVDWDNVSVVDDVTAETSEACFEVEAVYDAHRVAFSPNERKTIEIRLPSDWLWGCKIDLIRGDYVKVSLYNEKGMCLAETLILVE